MKNDFFHAILEIARDLSIPNVIIGALALPAYNYARATIDIDLCIFIKSQEKMDKFIAILKEKGIFTQQNPKINHDLFTVFSKLNEAEIWLKPCDAFDWDEQMLEKIKLFYDEIHILAIEDFLLTKLARGDRSAIDLSDVINLLIINEDKIDWKYFCYRLNWIGLMNEFITIIKAFELDYNENVRRVSKRILEKFKRNNTTT